MKRFLVILLVTLSALVLVPQAAQASPYSYTRNHCISFAQEIQAERWRAATRQVLYLTRPYTVNTVEAWADAFTNDPRPYYFRGVVNSCYNLVF